MKSYSTQNVSKTVLVDVAKTLLASGETSHNRHVSDSSGAHVVLTTEAQNHHDNNDSDDVGLISSAYSKKKHA